MPPRRPHTGLLATDFKFRRTVSEGGSSHKSVSRQQHEPEIIKRPPIPRYSTIKRLQREEPAAPSPPLTTSFDSSASRRSGEGRKSNKAPKTSVPELSASMEGMKIDFALPSFPLPMYGEAAAFKPVRAELSPPFAMRPLRAPIVLPGIASFSEDRLQSKIYWQKTRLGAAYTPMAAFEFFTSST